MAYPVERRRSATLLTEELPRSTLHPVSTTASAGSSSSSSSFESASLGSKAKGVARSVPATRHCAHCGLGGRPLGALVVLGLGPLTATSECRASVRPSAPAAANVAEVSGPGHGGGVDVGGSWRGFRCIRPAGRAHRALARPQYTRQAPSPSISVRRARFFWLFTARKSLLETLISRRVGVGQRGPRCSCAALWVGMSAGGRVAAPRSEGCSTSSACEYL